MINCTKKQIRELKSAVRWKLPVVLLRESGMTQRSLAEAMGVSLSTVNRAHMAFDHGGIQALKPKPTAGRQRETGRWQRRRPAATVFQGRRGRRDPEHP
jgi:transposase